VSVKRLNYFTHQFLREQDFKDEQHYHVEMRRRHNRLFHSWGVAEGLEVQRKGEREITITPGSAIDGEGREIVLLTPAHRDLSSVSRDSHIYVTIGYHEQWDESDHHTAGGVEGYTRVAEAPEVSEKKNQPPADGSVVTLAKVHVNDVGHVGAIDMGASVRKRAISPSPAAGWVRLPFKPVRLNPVRTSGRLVRVVSQEIAEEYEFIVDEATAYCDEKGARGSMEVPVPPAAARITGFRVAGTTRGSVTVHLHRTGWNVHENKGEKTLLLQETFGGPTFHRDLHADAPLDESHALAVSVIAEGETYIWLVAAKFE
jgi:hypothetical protein